MTGEYQIPLPKAIPTTKTDIRYQLSGKRNALRSRRSSSRFVRRPSSTLKIRHHHNDIHGPSMSSAVVVQLPCSLPAASSSSLSSSFVYHYATWS